MEDKDRKWSKIWACNKFVFSEKDVQKKKEKEKEGGGGRREGKCF